MKYICKAPGCSSPASTAYGHYCHSHKAQLRRHGAVGQRAITKSDLKLYRTLVSTRLENNKGQPIWTQLEARWKAIVSGAGKTVAASQAGKPLVRYQREAAREILKLNAGANIKELIETILAIYVMQDQEPRKFKSETAFRTQLVRRTRGLTPLNADTWVDPTTGRTKRVYRDLSAQNGSSHKPMACRRVSA